MSAVLLVHNNITGTGASHKTVYYDRIRYRATWTILCTVWITVKNAPS